MIINKLTKLLLLSSSFILLAGCETCPNSIQQAEIGIRISPMACITKSKKVEKPAEPTKKEETIVEDAAK